MFDVWSFLPQNVMDSSELPSPPLNLQTVQAPFLSNPPSISVFRELLTLKVGFFSESPKYLSFASLTPSHLLKVTKFLVKTSQFEFLGMIEKNIFVYKRLPLNISDFSLVFL